MYQKVASSSVVLGLEEELGYPMPEEGFDYSIPWPNRLWSSFNSQEISLGCAFANGARGYTDFSHPEMATPEVSNAYDAVRYSWAGRILFSKIVRKKLAEDEFKAGMYPNTKTFDAATGNSFAFHENYRISRRPGAKMHQQLKALIPILALRQIFCGAGGLVSLDGSLADNYVCSPRGLMIETVSSIDTMTRRPAINMRDEPQGDPSFYRFHVITGDGQAFQNGIYLSVGIMLVALHLFERGHFAPRSQLAELFAYDTTKTSSDFRRIAKSLGRWRIEGMKKPEMRDALTAFKTFLLYAKAHIRPPELSYEQKHVIEVCLELCDRLRSFEGTFDKKGRFKGNLNLVRKWVPWVTKLHFLRFLQRSLPDDEEMKCANKLASIELELHHADPKRSTGYAMTYLLPRSEEIAAHRIVPKSALNEACNRPPKGMRGNIRGYLVSQLSKLIVPARIGWDRVDVNGDYAFELPDAAHDYAELKVPIDDAIKKIRANL